MIHFEIPRDTCIADELRDVPARQNQLDVSFREDAARNRKGNGPANIAILRRRALDVARRDTSKGSLSIKLKRAGWDDMFLLNPLKQLDRS